MNKTNVNINKDFVIYCIQTDRLHRFTGTNKIVLYACIDEARNDATNLGAGYFVHKVTDALPHHLEEIKVQIINDA